MSKTNKAAILAIIAAFFLAGCNRTAAPVETEAPLPIVPMEAEELARVEAAFDVAWTEEGELKINPANCFLTSYYESVDKIDLQAFLRYFPGSELGGEAEFEALRNMKDWPFSHCEKLSDMPVPLHRHSADAVRAVFEKYTNISLEALDYVNAPGVYYLEEHDAFYNYTSDFGLFPLHCVRGEKQGDRLYIYSEEYGEYPDKIMVRLTLEKQGDDYIVISRMPVEDE